MDDDRTFLLVSSTRPRLALEAIAGVPARLDLCVKSPSDEARRMAELAFRGRYVRMLDEPLLAARRLGESQADFAWRCADALRALYALETHSAFVVLDAFFGPGETPLLLDGATLLRFAESIERAVPLP